MARVGREVSARPGFGRWSSALCVAVLAGLIFLNIERDPAPLESTVDPGFNDMAASPYSEAVDELAAAGVVGGHADGSFRPDDALDRGAMATFLARAMSLSSSRPAPFDDARGTTHERAIAAIHEAGIAGGYADGSYRPAATMSRGEVAAFLARARSLEGAEPPPFSDTAGTPHEDAIAAIVAEGYAAGFDDGTFRPSEPVTRGQVAMMLTRAFDL